MMSILQRYRHLLQDLNLDDEDFLGGMKVCFMVNQILVYCLIII